MYTRFVRWASDRLSDDGIVCFIMGRKPISKAAYDGFRKVVEREFSEIWLMDLGGDVRDNPKIAGTTHNVFGIQTGVVIAILVRRRGQKGAKIQYARRPEFELKEDKLAFLSSARSVSDVRFDRVVPDKKHDWLDQPTSEWDTLLALANPKIGAGDSRRAVNAIFRLTSSGLETGRDDWVYDRSKSALREKVGHLLNLYRSSVSSGQREVGLKLDRQLNRLLRKQTRIEFVSGAVQKCTYRVFSRRTVYYDKTLNSYQFKLPYFFRDGEQNPTIAYDGMAASYPLAALAVDSLFDKGLMKVGNGRAFGVSRLRYTKSGERVDNITDWALSKFVAHYGKRAGVTKDAIFAYCYAVLHDPLYREKYALNLKREFPRIPFYDDFAQWGRWGQQLLDLHIGYEKAKPFKFTRIDTPNPKRAKGSHPKPKLKSEPDKGLVIIDEDTQLSSIPGEAWGYRLGNRSAIDWVLDQHKEKTPRDPTVREKFNTYRFADYKESMIELLGRVVTVSLETVKITEAMRDLERTKDA